MATTDLSPRKSSADAKRGGQHAHMWPFTRRRTDHVTKIEGVKMARLAQVRAGLVRLHFGGRPGAWHGIQMPTIAPIRMQDWLSCTYYTHKLIALEIL